MDPPFRLVLFGTPRICSTDQPVKGFRTRKALALLCYLAAHATNHDAQAPLTRTHLADLFWGNLPEAKGRSNLSYVLHNLNDLFPGVLRTTRDMVALDRNVLCIDACEFRAQAALGTAESLTCATGLYHDEFLAGLFLDDCPEFEVWLVSERERWRQRVVSVLECLSGYHARRAEHERALPFVARILDIEPWREEAHRHMMHLLARTGQRSAALQQYDICRRVLAEELGEEPGAETLALYEKIRAEEIAPSVHAAPPHNLPTQLTSFVGRETELARIDARLKNPDCRLLTLVGAGGIGKTRLALEAAKQHLNTFEDGMFFVPLAAIPQGQSEFIVPAVANALAITFAGPQDLETQLLNFLRGKKMLLILDNFEQLLRGTEGANGAELVLEILQQAPQVKIVVTSREPLDMQAEWILRVGGLNYPTSIALALFRKEDGLGDTLPNYSAVQLFVERAKQSNGDFALGAQTSAAVVRICQGVEGMPLAIELAAAVLKSLPVGKIAEQIGANAELATSMRDVESRHQSLRAVLDWSYGLLSEAEKAMLQRLSVFAGGWTIEAAAAVCSGEGIEPERTIVLLNNLVDKSLVLREEKADGFRYRMLKSARQYANCQLMLTNRVERTRCRHVEYYAKWVRQFEREFCIVDRRAECIQIEPEYDNLRATLEWATEHHPGSWSGGEHAALQVVNALCMFWMQRGYLTEGVRWFQRVLECTEGSNQSTLRARAILGVGTFCYLLGDLNSASDFYDESVAMLRQVGEKQDLAEALLKRSYVAYTQGDMHLRKSLAVEALALYREMGEPMGIVESLRMLGSAAHQAGDYDTAGALLQECLEKAEHLADRVVITYILRDLGRLAYARGQNDEARQMFEESLRRAKELEHKMLAASLVEHLAYLARQEGRYHEATILLSESLEDSLDTGKVGDTARILVQLAAVALEQSDPERAGRLFGAGEALGQSSDWPIPYYVRADYVNAMDALQEYAKDTSFRAARAAGRAMTQEQAIAYALQTDVVV